MRHRCRASLPIRVVPLIPAPPAGHRGLVNRRSRAGQASPPGRVNLRGPVGRPGRVDQAVLQHQAGQAPASRPRPAGRRPRTPAIRLKVPRFQRVHMAHFGQLQVKVLSALLRVRLVRNPPAPVADLVLSN